MAQCEIWWDAMLREEEREGMREGRERETGLVRGRHATCREEGWRKRARERGKSLKATAASSMVKVATMDTPRSEPFPLSLGEC
ncbi:hypothetical protein C1H46_023723 [Malus baccata]|uniref:Uncharacterized protein n=1 Tax=Malus baccata TaxID=106549 RepID=A0A540LW33_MALBA|nr:hypothetical protein C1H46_023723 [Malus baccata]